jgi:hypothetical protein
MMMLVVSCLPASKSISTMPSLLQKQKTHFMSNIDGKEEKPTRHNNNGLLINPN